MAYDRKWKSLAEARAEQDKLGFVCRRCGCRDFKIARTTRGNGVILRIRLCRHCGRRIITTEVPLI